MITIGKHPEMSHDELQAYWEHANRAYPDEHGTVDIEFDGEFADLTYNLQGALRCAVPAHTPHNRLPRRRPRAVQQRQAARGGRPREAYGGVT